MLAAYGRVITICTNYEWEITRHDLVTIGINEQYILIIYQSAQNEKQLPMPGKRLRLEYCASIRGNKRAKLC